MNSEDSMKQWVSATECSNTRSLCKCLLLYFHTCVSSFICVFFWPLTVVWMMWANTVRSRKIIFKGQDSLGFLRKRLDLLVKPKGTPSLPMPAAWALIVGLASPTQAQIQRGRLSRAPKGPILTNHPEWFCTFHYPLQTPWGFLFLPFPSASICLQPSQTSFKSFSELTRPITLPSVSSKTCIFTKEDQSQAGGTWGEP